MTVGNAQALEKRLLGWIGAGITPSQFVSNSAPAPCVQAAWSARGAFTNLNHLMAAAVVGSHAAPPPQN